MGQGGNYAPVDYFPLATPIPITDVTGRALSSGPFATTGEVKQSYLFQLDSSFAQGLREQFIDRWPSDSPWSVLPKQMWLFQAVPDRWNLVKELETWAVGEEETWVATRYRHKMRRTRTRTLFRASGRFSRASRQGLSCARDLAWPSATYLPDPLSWQLGSIS